jgi:hypothetical protein
MSKLTGSERVIELLKQGKPVFCGVSDNSQEAADNYADNPARTGTGIHNLITVREDRGFVSSPMDEGWRFASPVDLSLLGNKVEA